MGKRFQKATLIVFFAATSSASMSAPATSGSNELVLEALVIKDAPLARQIPPGIIHHIERLVKLPTGAKPFAEYERFYTKGVVGGRDAISAEFIVPIWPGDNTSLVFRCRMLRNLVQL
jgi:hypothetical protein